MTEKSNLTYEIPVVCLQLRSEIIKSIILYLRNYLKGCTHLIFCMLVHTQTHNGFVCKTELRDICLPNRSGDDVITNRESERKRASTTLSFHGISFSFPNNTGKTKTSKNMSIYIHSAAIAVKYKTRATYHRTFSIHTTTVTQGLSKSNEAFHSSVINKANSYFIKIYRVDNSHQAVHPCTRVNNTVIIRHLKQTLQSSVHIF